MRPVFGCVGHVLFDNFLRARLLSFLAMITETVCVLALLVPNYHLPGNQCEAAG